MNIQKLAETVLYQIEHFWLLQELDETIRRNNNVAISFLDHVYSGRSTAWKALIPFTRLNTTLSSLLVPLSFVARFSDEDLAKYGFNIKAEYSMRMTCNGEPVPATSQLALRTLRNAVAHVADFAIGGKVEEPNISFDKGILRCQSRNNELVFDSEAGFVHFLSDLLRTIKAATIQFIGGS